MPAKDKQPSILKKTTPKAIKKNKPAERKGRVQAKNFPDVSEDDGDQGEVDEEDEEEEQQVNEMEGQEPNTTYLYLKAAPKDIKPFTGSSNTLIPTKLPMGENARQYYLENLNTVEPPVISSSEFVPQSLVEHLMRNKKDEAIAVKFVSGRRPADQITNMEGAMHTFVTPIVLAYMHGDYIYRYGHEVLAFAKGDDGMQQARRVIISASIQLDFESKRVMFAVSALGEEEVIGLDPPSPFEVVDTKSKQDRALREEYDHLLKSYMVGALTRDRRLPEAKEVDSSAMMSMEQTVEFLEDHIKSESSSFEDICSKYTRINKISIELLFNSAKHQLRNEISALEVVAPQGYVYTSDPAVIFAQEIEPQILNRIMFAALKALAAYNTFSKMKVFAFNDFADGDAVDLIKCTLKGQPHILVVPKADLFKGPKNTYKALPGSEDSLLVIHNNSDAFGQNIETEAAGGSLDGAIGAHSSAAASLIRNRKDLVDFQHRHL